MGEHTRPQPPGSDASVGQSILKEKWDGLSAEYIQQIRSLRVGEGIANAAVMGSLVTMIMTAFASSKAVAQGDIGFATGDTFLTVAATVASIFLSRDTAQAGQGVTVPTVTEEEVAVRRQQLQEEYEAYLRTTQGITIHHRRIATPQQESLAQRLVTKIIELAQEEE